MYFRKIQGFLLLCFCLIITRPSALGQVSSSDCAEDILFVSNAVNANELLFKDGMTYLSFEEHVFYNQDPPEKSVKFKKEMMVSGQIYYFRSAEEEVYMDGEESFYYYPQRDLLVRSGSTLLDQRVIRDLDPKVFEFGIVTECDFHKANDTLAYKRIRFVVDEKYRPRFKLETIEITMDPVRRKLLTVELHYFLHPEKRMATYEFNDIKPDYQPEKELASPADLFLDENGKLNEQFASSTFLDRR